MEFTKYKLLWATFGTHTFGFRTPSLSSNALAPETHVQTIQMTSTLAPQAFELLSPRCTLNESTFHGAHLLLGPAWSKNTITSNLVSRELGVPQIPTEATSPILSDVSVHPLLARVVPDDTIQGRLHNTLLEVLGVGCVISVASSDSYSTNGRAVFLNWARNSSIVKVWLTQTGPLYSFHSLSPPDPISPHGPSCGPCGRGLCKLPLSCCPPSMIHSVHSRRPPLLPCSSPVLPAPELWP